MAVRIRTDEAIQADVLEELKWDSRVRPNEIGVAVKDGIVTLTGWIDSYLKKMSAQCVTKWSKLDTHWEGVSLDTLLAQVTYDASYVLAFSDGAIPPTYRCKRC